MKRKIDGKEMDKYELEVNKVRQEIWNRQNLINVEQTYNDNKLMLITEIVLYLCSNLDRGEVKWDKSLAKKIVRWGTCFIRDRRRELFPPVAELESNTEAHSKKIEKILETALPMLTNILSGPKDIEKLKEEFTSFLNDKYNQLEI
jgi:hypothetical protein